MASLACLPSELLHIICDFLSDDGEGISGHLCSFALVSKRCCAIADRKRFHEIRLTVGGKRELQADLEHWNTILKRRSAFEYVRRFVLRCVCSHKATGPTTIERVAEKGWHPVNWECPAIPGDLTPRKINHHSLTPAEICKRNEAWRPVAQFIVQLSGLRDFFYVRTNQLPSCLLDVLHQKLPGCRLHLRSFFLHNLLRRNETREWERDSYGYTLITSPNLYSIAFPWHHPSIFGNAIALQLLEELSPNVKEVLVGSKYHIVQEPLQDSISGQLQGATQPRSLEKLIILNSPLATIEFFQAWSQLTVFSKLRVLLLPEGVQLNALMWLRECKFDSLEDLTINIRHDWIIDKAGLEQRDRAAGDFLRSLPSLKELRINGRFGENTFQAILDCHGSALRRLSFRGTYHWNSPCVTADMINNLWLHCHELQKLSLPVMRSQGDAREVSHYRALSRFPKLKELYLRLDYTTHRSPAIKTYNDIQLRNMLINSAVDSSLARSIFEIISQGKQTALKRLTLSTWGDECLNEPGSRFPLCYPDIVRYISNGVWRCTRSQTCSDVVVEKLDDIHIIQQRGKPSDLGGTDYLFRSIWPEKRGETWREDWHSLPLQLD